MCGSGSEFISGPISVVVQEVLLYAPSQLAHPVLALGALHSLGPHNGNCSRTRRYMSVTCRPVQAGVPRERRGSGMGSAFNRRTGAVTIHQSLKLEDEAGWRFTAYCQI